MSDSEIPDLAALSVRNYSAALASDQPSPGGGSAAALCGALGASLVQMACGINFKRAKNPNRELSSANGKKIEQIRQEFLRLVTLDAQCYEKLSHHWKNKTPQLEEALKEACQVPFGIGTQAIAGLVIASSERGNTSAMLMSDLIEASHFLFAAIRCAGLHVDINLKSIQDTVYVRKMRREWAAAFAEARKLHVPFEKAAD